MKRRLSSCESNRDAGIAIRSEKSRFVILNGLGFALLLEGLFNFFNDLVGGGGRFYEKVIRPRLERLAIDLRISNRKFISRTNRMPEYTTKASCVICTTAGTENPGALGDRPDLLERCWPQSA